MRLLQEKRILTSEVHDLASGIERKDQRMAGLENEIRKYRNANRELKTKVREQAEELNQKKYHTDILFSSVAAQPEAIQEVGKKTNPFSMPTLRDGVDEENEPKSTSGSDSVLEMKSESRISKISPFVGSVPEKGSLLRRQLSRLQSLETDKHAESSPYGEIYQKIAMEQESKVLTAVTNVGRG